jgi:hypothetical protein
MLPDDWPARRVLEDLAARQRIILLAGLPGVGKSLLVQQLTHMAHRVGRRVFLLQWDVARGAFETKEILARYPEVGGFTHAAIKRAAGRWARGAVLQWHRTQEPDTMLLGETPLVGGRLMELASESQDEVEALLSGPDTRFVLPVPSREVRAAIEAARERSIGAPAHERERADAPPNVLRGLWAAVYLEAQQAGLAPAPPPGGPVPYDADAYRAVYLSWLRHRRVTVIEMDRLLPVVGSVYDLGAVAGEVTPAALDVDRIMRIVDIEEGHHLP